MGARQRLAALSAHVAPSSANELTNEVVWPAQPTSLTPALRSSLLELDTPFICDARVRLGLPESFLDPMLRPVAPLPDSQPRLVGTAITIRIEPAVEGPRDAQERPDADLSLYGIAQSSPPPWAVNPILVFEVHESLHRYRIFGSGAATGCRAGGYVAALIEGAVADTLDLKKMAFPAWSRVISPAYIVGKAKVASVGRPISVGGRTIATGDVMLLDNDGVVIVGSTDVEVHRVVTKAADIREWETKVHAMIAAGHASADAIAEVGPMP
jgi:regulator of RNase E activity RraA